MQTRTLLSYKSPLSHSFQIVKQSFAPFSGRPVKRVSLVAGLHGDELEGVSLCSRLIRYLRELEQTRPQAIKGAVNIYPAANPQAIGDATRLWPFFGQDMNRQFGGRSGASLPSHFSRRFLEDLISCSDLVVDFHAGNLHLQEAPQIRIIRKFDKKLIPLARQCNVDLIWVHPMAKVFESTLSYNLNRRKIPTLVIEAGTGLRLIPAAGEQIFSGILHFLHHLGILDLGKSGPPAVKNPLLAGPEQVVVVNAKHPGLFIKRAALGQNIRQGETLGEVVDPCHGTVLEELKSPANGFIFTLRELPLAYSGAILARIATKNAEPK
ncbi:MAG: M14 family metallopeptidase [Nitrospinales bacterium]